VDEETMPSHWSVLRVLFRLQCFTLMAGSHKGHPVRNMRSKKFLWFSLESQSSEKGGAGKPREKLAQNSTGTTVVSSIGGNLVVHMEQSVSVAVCLCGRTVTSKFNDLKHAGAP